MIKLKDIISEIQSKQEYKELSVVDKNLYESYTLLGELLNPNNAYPYEKEINGLWTFKDDREHEFFVRLVYQPSNPSYWEIKMGWSDLDNSQRYQRQPEKEIDEKRSDTIAAIYRDEILPFFTNQDFNNTLIISPLDIKRYQFSIRLIKKFTPTNLTIVEDKPNKITITK